jgi:hypothetical protein
MHIQSVCRLQRRCITEGCYLQTRRHESLKCHKLISVSIGQSYTILTLQQSHTKLHKFYQKLLGV